MTKLGNDFIKMDFTGPFFVSPNPGATMFQNLQTMMQGIAIEGQATARHNLMNGATRRELVSVTHDRVADHVFGRITSIYGKKWYEAAVVSVLNRGMSRDQAVSVLAAGSELESETHTFLNIRRSVRDFRALHQADLAKGLA